MTLFVAVGPVRLAGAGVTGFNGEAAPIAAFSLSPSSGTAPLAVSITNTTSFASSYLWSVTGGTLSSTTDAEPTWTISSAGTYSITLVATGPGGSSQKTASATATSGAAGWQFADAGTLSTGRNTTTPLYVGLSGSDTYYASPDLLPGQTLQLSGGTLNILGSVSVPTVDASDSGAAGVLDTISGRDVAIEVMASPYARARNLRYPLVYWGHDEPADTIFGLPGGHSRLAHVLNPEYGTTPCMSGDTIEISPGSIATTADNLNPDGHSCYLPIYTSCTVKNIDGRGRWGLVPSGTYGEASTHGILILRPGACWNDERVTVVIQGFAADNIGNNASHIRIASDAAVNGSWATYAASVTVRNFKFGTQSGRTSLSAISGAAETLVLEDGHIYDCGNGSGQEHNAYVSARTMTLRGVRTSRTRGWSGTPYAGGVVKLEGHMAKLSAVTGTVEGCVFDAAQLADHSLLLQLKAGGNWTVRGNVFIDSQAPNVARGAITMLREYSGDGVTPNFAWWAGLEGNSLDFQRNVFIGHYPRSIIFFRDAATYPLQALYAAGDTSVGPERRLASALIRDNVAMVTSSQVYGSWMLAGFPGTNNQYWIRDDPNGGTYWDARGNTTMTYAVNEAGFADDERTLKIYRRLAGTVAANGGTMATQRFVWPHGYMARSDAYQGAG